MSDNLIDAIDALTRAVLTLAAKPCCGSVVQPTPMLNCETGTVTWLYPPQVPGSGAVAIDPETGGITVDPVEYTSPGYSGKTGGDYGIGYGDEAKTPPDGSADWDAFNDELCRKANWYVVEVAKPFLNELLSLKGLIETTTGLASTLAGIFASYAGGALYVGELAIWTGAASVSIPVSILSAAALVLGFVTKPTIMADYAEIEQQLVCAIYNGKSGVGIKAAWDAVIDANFYGFAPQAWLFKSLMWADVANRLSDGTLTSDRAFDYYECTGCTPEGWIPATHATTVSAYENPQVRTFYVLDWATTTYTTTDPEWDLPWGWPAPIEAYIAPDTTFTLRIHCAEPGQTVNYQQGQPGVHVNVLEDGDTQVCEDFVGQVTFYSEAMFWVEEVTLP